MLIPTDSLVAQEALDLLEQPVGVRDRVVVDSEVLGVVAAFERGSDAVAAADRAAPTRPGLPA